MTPSPTRRRLLGASVLPVALSLAGCGGSDGTGGSGQEPISDGGGAHTEGPPPSPDRCLPAEDAARRSPPAPPEHHEAGPENEASPDRHLSSHGLALFSDGTRIAANQTSDARMLGESDTFGTVVWSTEDGSVIESFDNGLIGAIAADRHGHLAVAGVVNVEISEGDGEPVRALTGGDEPFGPLVGALIDELAFTADGSRLVVLGADGTVTVWNLDGDTCEVEHELATDLTSVTALSISPADDSLAVCGEGGPVELWDPSTGSRTGTVEGLPGTAAGLAHADDGTLILCTDGERAVHALSRSGTLTTGPELTNSGPYWAAAGPGGRVAVVAHGGNRVQVWERETEETTELPVVRGSVGRLVWSPDGSTLYGASPREGVIAWSGAEDWVRFETP